MSAFLGEFIGTAILVLLGNGVVANVLLNDTKGRGAGWIAIALGWGMAVFAGALIATAASGAHINPAVTIGLAVQGTFEWSRVPMYLVAQMAGGALGAALVWLHYKSHFDRTEDRDAKLAAFCTGPAIRNPALNVLSEIIATFVLVLGVIYKASPEGGLGSLDVLPVAFIVLGIGLSLGGTTGYAINPARDLSPRLVHFLLPMRNKRDSDWGYAWIPVVGPIVGGVLAALVYTALV
jgi:glycerol uptake facilitator protein